MRTYLWLVGGSAALLAATPVLRALARATLKARRQRAAWPLEANRPYRTGLAPRPAEPLGGYWQAGGATRTAAKRRRRP